MFDHHIVEYFISIYLVASLCIFNRLLLNNYESISVILLLVDNLISNV